MNVTYLFRFHAKEHDCCSGECLCSFETAVSIAFALCKSRRNERFYFTLINIQTGQTDEIGGLKRDGRCYYLEPSY